MKIGVICPVGPLDRYGYQYNYMTIMENLAAFATQVYIISSSRNRDLHDLLSRFPNVDYIFNEDTRFDVDATGNEVFSMEKLEHNVNLALQKCKEDGMDCAIQMHINQYVQDRNKDNLRRLCGDMLEAGRPFEWLYKKYQLGNRLFHADTRVPWILNLQIDQPFVIRADSIHHRDSHERYKIEHGDFRSKDHIAIVDCPMEMTWQDLEEKMRFLYGGSVLGANVDPCLGEYLSLPYYLRKFNQKLISNEPLDATGQVIARNSRSDFVSWTLLKHYQKVNAAGWFVRFLGRFL